MTAAGNSQGFVVSGTTSINTRGGDINGDGLSDIIVKQNGTISWVVYGRTSSPGLFNVSSLGATDGFKISMADVSNFAHSVVGDVNGDGFDDMLFNLASGNYLLYGSASSTAVTLPASPAVTGTYTNGFYIAPASGASYGGVLPTASGDFHGDGYSDFVLNNYDTTATGYVVYGGSALGNLSMASLATAGNGRGFSISAVGAASASYYATNTGDVNGDGLDDFILNDGNGNDYVVFGKTDSSPVNLTALGSGGFVIQGNSAGSIDYTSDVDVIGDFNGDGLADLLISNTNLTSQGVKVGGATVVYGRTGTSTVVLSALTPDQGFRIQGISSDINLGQFGASAVGDVNGDGFADIAITARLDDPTNPLRTDAGITRVVFGGVDKLESMTFQALNGDAVGTTGDDTLTGTSGANQLVAGDGNDTLIGAGGADVLYGGRGNDTIVINASNITALYSNVDNASQAIARIDGGSGIDVLQLDGAGITLDLTAIRSAAVTSVEHVDITGSGANTVKLSLTDVLQMGDNNLFDVNTSAIDSRQQLMISGDADDKVVLTDLASWTQQSSSTFTRDGQTYNVWNHNTANAQLLIDQDILLSNITVL